MRLSAGFNRIAPVYDRLVHFVFGNAVRASQDIFLPGIPAGSSILVLGGGTGEFLPELLSQCPGCRILFIDASSEMIVRAKRRIRSDAVVFITGTEDSIPDGSRFDAVLTFFFLDLFDNCALPKIVEKISRVLTPEGKWLVADFENNGKWWQLPFLKFMYLFFRFTSGLETRELPMWKNELERAGFACVEKKSFYAGFIHGVVYQRNAATPA